MSGRRPSIIARGADLVRDVLQTLFRFVRVPCTPGLVAIGTPDRSSPVLVTCNYSYTVRHLEAYLTRAEIDCHLLIVDTKGTNVWCAAAEGLFDTDKLLAHLDVYGVADRVDHRELILPQLAAPGVKRHSLREHGWTGIWGPVYLEYIGHFLDHDRTLAPHMKRLYYGYRDRLYMGLSHAVFCTLICALPILALYRTHWVAGFAAVIFLALAMQLLEHFIPVQRLLYKGMVFALVPVAIALMGQPPGDESMRMVAGLVALGAYVGFDSQGHSHLAQNQRSGRLLSVVLGMALAVHGGSFLL